MYFYHYLHYYIIYYLLFLPPLSCHRDAANIEKDGNGDESRLQGQEQWLVDYFGIIDIFDKKGIKGRSRKMFF